MKEGLDIPEKQLESQVRDLAKIFGWKYYHTWRSIHSPAGFPDDVLVKPPRLIFAELKSTKGKVSPEQQSWLDTLSLISDIEVYLWYPKDIEEITRVLSGQEII